VCSTALSVVSCDPSDSCHIDSVLGGIIQPLLQSCRLGGQALQQAEMAIFMLNNVSVLQVRGRWHVWVIKASVSSIAGGICVLTC
jgi:hypothetical protein